MNLQTVFMKRSYTIYKHMGERFAEKKNKNGRIIQHGRALPFTLAELRQWIQAQMPKSHGQCCYCQTWIDFADLTLDHDVPASRNGSLELSNLAICCDECNRIKGKLSGSEYRAFRKGLETFPEAARRDIYSRLKQGAGFTRMRFMKPKPQPAPTAISATEEF